MSGACSSLSRQEKLKTQVWFELVTSLKIMFKFELVEKPKSLSLAWLDQLVKPTSGLISNSNSSLGQVFELEI